MFGRIGTGELILILVIALIVVGPSKLPELGRTFGKTLNEFKKFSKDLQEDFSVEDSSKKSKIETKETKDENIEVANKEDVKKN